MYRFADFEAPRKFKPNFDDYQEKYRWIDIYKNYSRWEKFDILQDTLDGLLDLERGI